MMSERRYKVGDRIAFENLGYFSTGTISVASPRGYEVKWDDGFVDELNWESGEPFVYDGYELIPLSEVDPALVMSRQERMGA